MDNETIINKIKEIIQIDIDAVFAYSQAMSYIDNDDIYIKISKFHDDHVNHVTNLNAIISDLGGTSIKIDKDFKAPFIQGFVYLNSMMNTEDTLNAIESNEALINNYYKQFLVGSMLPEEINNILETNLADEQKHLEDIKSMLK